MNKNIWGGILHATVPAFVLLYTFFMRTIWVDFVYLLLFFVLNFQWLFLRGECLVSYLHKQRSDPAYELGGGSLQLEDLNGLISWLPKDKFEILLRMCNALYSINLLIVFLRNGFNPAYSFAMVGSYWVYTSLLRFPSLSISVAYPYFHFCIISLGLFFFLVH
jgi:hypothetical protein